MHYHLELTADSMICHPSHAQDAEPQRLFWQHHLSQLVGVTALCSETGADTWQMHFNWQSARFWLEYQHYVDCCWFRADRPEHTHLLAPLRQTLMRQWGMPDASEDGALPLKT
jgi:hypothetical protein